MPKKAPPSFAAYTLPTEHLAAMGDVVFKWGRLEYQISVLISECFEIPIETGRVFMHNAQISKLCGLLKSATATDHWIKDEPLRKEIGSFADAVNEKRNDRHGVAHALIGFNLASPDDYYRYNFASVKTKISPATELVSVIDLASKATVAGKFVSSAVELLTRLQALRRK